MARFEVWNTADLNDGQPEEYGTQMHQFALDNAEGLTPQFWTICRHEEDQQGLGAQVGMGDTVRELECTPLLDCSDRQRALDCAAGIAAANGGTAWDHTQLTDGERIVAPWLVRA